MSEFKEYKRTNIAEMRPVTEEEANSSASHLRKKGVSISDPDIANGSPLIGDMIARNPDNHADQWLVSASYFENNFLEFISKEMAVGFSFGYALELMKQEYAVARRGWNGKGMFVFKQIPANIGPDIIPRMQSVPDRVKGIIMDRDYPALNYTNQFAIVHPDGRVDSWSPSVSDCLARDWEIVE